MTDDLLRDSRLGEASDYPQHYAPEILYPLPRSASRDALGIAGVLPFAGVDIWNAWELTWLDPAGKPRIATATLRFAADTVHIIESKSLKLYLNGFANSRYNSAAELKAVIETDLGRIVDGQVAVELTLPAAFHEQHIATLPGRSLDDVDVVCDADEVDPSLLHVGQALADETLHTHLLRSLCPVTGQPDTGSLLVSYSGPQIDPGALLRYVVSFRRHNDFHEACVERIFLDLQKHCRCEQLTVYARYNRRGGIDINPFRSNVATSADNPRLWRQ